MYIFGGGGGVQVHVLYRGLVVVLSVQCVVSTCAVLAWSLPKKLFPHVLIILRMTFQFAYLGEFKFILKNNLLLLLFELFIAGFIILCYNMIRYTTVLTRQLKLKANRESEQAFE
jgi:hypothetical protein